MGLELNGSAVDGGSPPLVILVPADLPFVSALAPSAPVITPSPGRIDIRFDDGEPLSIQPRYCVRCGFGRPHGFGLCRACYQYKYRTGQDRPWVLITKAGELRLARQGEGSGGADRVAAGGAGARAGGPSWATGAPS